MNLRYICIALFTAAFGFSLNLYNSANANEPEHLCYFITRDNKVINLSNLCPTKKTRLKRNMFSREVNTSTIIRKPNFSHYPPTKFRVKLLK